MNRVRNPRLKAGPSGPRSWIWTLATGKAQWEQPARDDGGAPAGLRIVTGNQPATAAWTQILRCKPGDYYRVEAVVRCDLSAPDEASGFVLRIQAMIDRRPVGRRLTTPGLHRSRQPITVRAIYEAPSDVRCVEISAGLENAVGWVELIEVRFITVLEPDEESHILATPASPVSVEPPRVARTVRICTADGPQRPIVGLLSACLGTTNVRTVSPGGFRPEEVAEDALILPDAAPPKSIRTLRSLSKLAAERIVILSLPAFARLTGSTLHLRRIEQDDDPICAEVAFANHASHGFALLDVFAYSWAGKTPGSYVQTQFRNTPVFREFCRRNGFEVLLRSMCDADATSHQPIALCKAFDGGGLYVLDVEPVEATSSTRGESALAMHWLRSILGHAQVSLGQYVVPHSDETEFRAHIRDMADRFEGFFVHDAGVPTDEVTEQLVTIGREELGYGLPLKPKPLILIRSGLVSGDLESVYSAWLWFKQLVKAPPGSCPYIESLASRFRLAWIPSAARWEADDGWLRSGEPPAVEFEIDIQSEPRRSGSGPGSDRRADAAIPHGCGTEQSVPRPSGSGPAGKLPTDRPLPYGRRTEQCGPPVQENLIAALIDLVAVPVNRTRVVLPTDSRAYDRHRFWLPKLAEAFPAGQYFALRVGPGEQFADRERFAHQFTHPDLEVVTEPDLLEGPVFQRTLDSGGQVLRIEIPGCDADFIAHSIQRTDTGATVLEHVVGLQYGLIAVNRQPKPARLDGFSPIRPGEALVIDQNDPMLRASTAQVG